MVLHDKFALHQPLNRQSEAYAREGIDLPLSTLADHVGACAAVLAPLADLVKAHVLAGERLHGDDTPVPLLAKGKTITARLWTYVRDDRPFGGSDLPAALFFFSQDRSGEHPERHLGHHNGILQAYSTKRPHQGRSMKGRTPIVAFGDGLPGRAQEDTPAPAPSTKKHKEKMSQDRSAQTTAA